MAIASSAILNIQFSRRSTVIYTSIEEMRDDKFLSIGDSCCTPDGTFKIVAKQDIATNAVTVIDLLNSRQAILLPNEILPNVEAVIADTRPSAWLANGRWIETRDGHKYKIANSNDNNYHIANSGNAKLDIVPDLDGYYSVESFGFKGDGSAGDLAKLQLASNTSRYLKFQTRTYVLNEIVNTPAGYGSHRKCCLLAVNSVAWRTAGATTLKISDALQAGPNANDIAILFMADQEEFSAPRFTFDENAAGQGYGAPFACYGVDRIDVSEITTRNASPIRLGASPRRLCGEVQGYVTVLGGQGTFAIGGKPGGTRRWRNFGAHIENSRGGVNIECQDVDQRRLVHDMVEADIHQVIGKNIVDDSGPVEFVKIEDGAKRVNVELISLDTASSSTGRATALSIKQGQDGARMERVSVGRISGKNIRQAVYFEMEGQPQGDVVVGGIEADTVGCLFESRNTAGAAVAEAASVMIQSVQGKVQSPDNAELGTAFYVDTNPASGADNGNRPHLAHLSIGGGHLTSVAQRTFDVRGVRRFSVKNLSVDAHVRNMPSGGYAGPIYNVIEADEIVLDSVTLRGFRGTGVPLELRPKLSCRLVGLEIAAGGSGTALFVNGSGTVIIDGCSFSGASNAVNIRNISMNFNAESDIDIRSNIINIENHPFRHGERVKYSAGTSPIAGISEGSIYYVDYVDARSIRLSAALRGDILALGGAGRGIAKLQKDLNINARKNKNYCGTFMASQTKILSYTEDGTW